MNANEKAVAEVLAKYQDALNNSDTNAVMRLYAEVVLSSSHKDAALYSSESPQQYY